MDSAYAILISDINLLKPYKREYLDQALSVRDTIFFSYQHGAASLLDFLNAESEYRTVQLSYVNLVGSFLTSAAQVNLSVGPRGHSMNTFSRRSIPARLCLFTKPANRRL